MIGRVFVISLVGFLVPGLVLAQCPRDRIVEGVSCGRPRTSCPTGSTCQGSRCCWDQQDAVSSPCDDPMMRGGEFVTCEMGTRGRQGRGRSCPGQCHDCRDLSGVGLGLCCPVTSRRGCERASPAQVEFERQAAMIRGGNDGPSGGSGSSRFGSSSTFPDSFPQRSQDTFRSDVSRDSPLTSFRDSGRQTSRGLSMDRAPISDTRRMSPSSRRMGPCGVGIRPIGSCRRLPFVPPCPRGFYCVPNDFMGACCPVGARPQSPAGFDPRMGPRGFPGPMDRRRPGGPGPRDTMRGRTPGRLAGDMGQSTTRMPDRGSTTGSRLEGGVSSSRAGQSQSDFDRALFGPPPDENFPGGPIQTANTPRGQCPRAIQCNTGRFNECYTDAECPVPLRCCSRPGCRNICS